MTRGSAICTYPIAARYERRHTDIETRLKNSLLTPQTASTTPVAVTVRLWSLTKSRVRQRDLVAPGKRAEEDQEAGREKRVKVASPAVKSGGVQSTGIKSDMRLRFKR